MKTTLPILVTLAVAFGAAVMFAQDAAPAPTTPDPAASPAAKSKQETRKDQRKAERKAAKRGTTATTPATAAAPAEPEKPAEPEPQLRLNFRGVPLEMVLNYLSEAAGYTIHLETSVKGTVDVWSNQPLTRAEAVDLLNSVLNKNGYAAIQNGRMLSIVAKDEARKRNVPVKTGADPLGIPKNDEIVTQIVPVRYISAAQLVRELAQLLPPTAVVTANEAGNSLVITDTQANIRRLTEIISALDTAQSGVSGIKVFALKYADAKALATTVRDLFQDTGRGGSSSGSPGFSSRGGDSGRGGPGGSSDPRAAIANLISSRTGGPGGSSRGPAASTRVTAVADEHSNSLIVSASEDLMPTIEMVINSVDTDVQDLTELRVFTLKYSDPTEMAELLNNLFAEASSSDQSRGGGFRFGGGFPGFPGGGPPGSSSGSRSGSTGESERKKLQGSVSAVADPRTSSVVVSAAKELMPQIAEMVLQLDSNPARKQKVFVYSLDNANVTEVETVLRNLFESQSTRGTQNSQNQQNNALQNRQNTTSQQQQGITSGFGGFGQGGGGTGGNR